MYTISLNLSLVYVSKSNLALARQVNKQTYKKVLCPEEILSVYAEEQKVHTIENLFVYACTHSAFICGN